MTDGEAILNLFLLTDGEAILNLFLVTDEEATFHLFAVTEWLDRLVSGGWDMFSYFRHGCHY